jgi:hypothetical protein
VTAVPPPPERGITRRQALKAALAGASLTLPFGIGLARSAPAHGAIRSACSRGCKFVADKVYADAIDGCTYSAIASSASAILLPGGAIKSIVGRWTPLIAYQACQDTATFNHKATSWNCKQPNCEKTFDPYQKYGPCENCPPGKCCPSTSQLYGYSCCAQCCSKSGDGCGSGVTECGG